MRISPLEWEILEHRLAVGDCIAESLTDILPDEEPLTAFSPEEIEIRAGELWRNPDIINWKSDLDIEILENCCTSCTFFADIDEAVGYGELTKGKAAAYKRAANSLGKKLGVEVATW